MSVLFEFDDLIPLEDFAPNFSSWLSKADKCQSFENAETMRYYGNKLTVAESIFCNNYARHVVFGSTKPNLEEGSFDCSPMYRQALLEQIVRERLKSDNYVFPLAIKI